MKQEQQQQAEHLYFQTDLSKTQIAESIGVSRRTLHYWVRENNWDHLKRAAAAMPTLIVGNCYQMMAQLSSHISSAERSTKPVTREEVECLYKLTLTINKLKARITLNESMETFTGFIESLNNRSEKLADSIRPYITRYISSCAVADTNSMKPASADRPAPLSPEQVQREAQLDKEDIAAWSGNNKPSAPAEKVGYAPQPVASLPLSPYSAPVLPQSPEMLTKPKEDIRKQLRGTATKGPGKAFHQKQKHAHAA